MENKPIVVDANGKRLVLSLERAEQLAKDLQEKITAARKGQVGYIELDNGRLTARYLSEYFERLFPDDKRRSVFWTGKLFRKLLGEWAWGRMKLEVWCIYCSEYVSPETICEAAANYHRHYWHFEPYSIKAESILTEQQKFAIRHGEGEKMIVNFRLLVECLRSATQNPVPKTGQ